MTYFKKEIENYCNTVDRPLNFIQIGCNDGFMADPIHSLIVENGWNGVLVDADEFYVNQASETYFQKAKELIENKSLRFLHFGVVPIADGNYFSKFYSILPDAIRPRVLQDIDNNAYWLYGDKVCNIHDSFKNCNPITNNILDYLQGVGSFDYNFVLRHIYNVTKKTDASGDLSRKIFSTNSEEHKKFIKTQFIQCVSINDIFKFSNFKQVDLLQTDMELWDVKIMEDLDKFILKPKMIHFEAPGGISDDLRDKFLNSGYEINKAKDTKDQLAILK